jgi:hypothetical protein
MEKAFPIGRIESKRIIVHLEGKGTTLYYVSKRTGWVGLENGHLADVQYCVYADKVGGWGPKSPKIC